MKRLLILTALVSTCYASALTDHGISLIYQDKPDQAVAELKPLAKAGDYKAAFYASLVLIFGDKPDVSQGLPYLQQAVNAGYGPALDTLASLYLQADIIPGDIHKAKMYYEIAANRGYGPSQFNLGIMSKNGDGVPRDLIDAYVYLSLATDNIKDLGDLTFDTEQYRNEVLGQLNQEQLDEAHDRYLKMKKSIALKHIESD